MQSFSIIFFWSECTTRQLMFMCVIIDKIDVEVITIFHVRKVCNEGTSSPFINRMMLNICQIRDAALPRSEHLLFDEKHDRIYKSLFECRSHVLSTYDILLEYANAVNKGGIISIQNGTFSVEKTIDDELRVHFNGFMNSGIRAYKDVQELTKAFGLDIGAFYGKDANFDAFVNRLEGYKQKDLSNYLISVRKTWGKSFVDLRNQMEHSGWQLEELSYSLVGKEIEVALPQVLDKDFFEYMKFVFCQLTVFAESMIIYVLQTQNADLVLEMNNHPWTIQFNEIHDETLLIRG